jgi:hypothetical protein
LNEKGEEKYTDFIAICLQLLKVIEEAPSCGERGKNKSPILIDWGFFDRGEEFLW